MQRVALPNEAGSCLILLLVSLQRNRGFGFITFQDAETVEKVLKVPVHTLDGKKIDPKHATPKNRGRVANRTKKIFVGGVSQDTTTDEVKAYFNQFGKVSSSIAFPAIVSQFGCVYL